jgi:hypothetical protein
MNLKLDENLGRGPVDLFRRAGLDVRTVPEENLQGSDDRGLIAICRKERRCLVTLDLGFSNPLVFRPEQYAGIAVLRLPGKPDFEDLLDSCRTLIEGLRRDDVTGKLWIVQRSRIREYRPERPGEGS